MRSRRTVTHDDGFATLEKDVLMNLVVVVLASVSMSSFIRIEPLAATSRTTEDEGATLTLWLAPDGRLERDGPGGPAVGPGRLVQWVAEVGATRIDVVEHPDAPARVLVPRLAELRAETDLPIGLACAASDPHEEPSPKEAKDLP